MATQTNKENKNIDTSVDSEGEVEVVDNETASFLASKQVGSGSGYGTKSLYRRWKETVDDDYDPYDDDLYNDHGISKTSRYQGSW